MRGNVPRLQNASLRQMLCLEIFGRNPWSLVDACMWGRVGRSGEGGARSHGVSRAALAGGDEGGGPPSLSPSDLRTSERKRAWPRRRWTSHSISEGGCLMAYCPWWEGCPLTFRGGQWCGGWEYPCCWVCGHTEGIWVTAEHLVREGERGRKREMINEEMYNVFWRPFRRPPPNLLFSVHTIEIV